jgi:hypothetical protein
VSICIVTAWLGLVILHIGDDYRVRHTQGVWIAAVETARVGDLYPPLFDGERYAGTRYMPLPIVLNTLASSVAGDPLIGGKALAALLMLTLLALLVALLRVWRCPWPLAAALAAVVVATETGLQAGTSIGGDLLPVVLQVGALAAAMGRRPRAVWSAGILSGLAVASKLTGWWALFALLTWLAVQRRWNDARTMACVSLGTATIVLGGVQLATGGGLLEHLGALSTAGIQGPLSLLRGPNQVLFNLRTYAFGGVMLLPLALLGALLLPRWRQLSVVHFGLGYALLMLVVVFADIGTGFNQLLDIVVLTVLAVGHLAGRAAADADAAAARALSLAVAVCVVWAAGIDLIRTVGFDLRTGLAAARSGRPGVRAPALVAELVRPGETVLAEDPAVEVALGRRPRVMDPFMVARLGRRDPAQIDPLVRWITERRFDLVVLVVPLDNRDLDYWWSDYSFGSRVAAALRQTYRLDGVVGRYYLYRPKS